MKFWIIIKKTKELLKLPCTTNFIPNWSSSGIANSSESESVSRRSILEFFGPALRINLSIICRVKWLLIAKHIHHNKLCTPTELINGASVTFYSIIASVFHYASSKAIAYVQILECQRVRLHQLLLKQFLLVFSGTDHTTKMDFSG